MSDDPTGVLVYALSGFIISIGVYFCSLLSSYSLVSHNEIIEYSLGQLLLGSKRKSYPLNISRSMQSGMHSH
jgi:hypothetical protein